MNAADAICNAISPAPGKLHVVGPLHIANYAIDALMAGSDHVHLARQADGTVTATPMRAAIWRDISGEEPPPRMWVDEVSS